MRRRSSRLIAALALAWGGLAAGCTTYGEGPDRFSATGSGTGAAGAAAVASIAPGSYRVASGDTLYAVSRKANVPLRALIDANGLQPPYHLLAGQTLIIPAVRTHSVVPGDTLSGIARRYGVEASELARVNALQPPFVILAGQQLVLPGSSEAPGPAMAAAPPPAVVPPATSTPSSEIPGAVVVQPLAPPPLPGAPAAAEPAAMPLDGAVPVSEETAPVSTAPAPAMPGATVPGDGTAPGGLAPPPADLAPADLAPAAAPAPAEPLPDATPTAPATPALAPATPASAGPVVLPDPPARAGSKFIWPVDGPILSSFGPKEGGLHNDGINVAAARGTPIKAAENGVVAYAGSDLKGFGNLVLIKHAGGWVTAYAHADQLLVRRGDVVRRSQIIARVGSTGSVSTPQLHFEVRQGSRPVNPLPLMTAQTAGL